MLVLKVALCIKYLRVCGCLEYGVGIEKTSTVKVQQRQGANRSKDLRLKVCLKVISPTRSISLFCEDATGKNISNYKQLYMPSVIPADRSVLSHQAFSTILCFPCSQPVHLPHYSEESHALQFFRHEPSCKAEDSILPTPTILCHHKV